MKELKQEFYTKFTNNKKEFITNAKDVWGWIKINFGDKKPTYRAEKFFKQLRDLEEERSELIKLVHSLQNENRKLEDKLKEHKEDTKIIKFLKRFL